MPIGTYQPPEVVRHPHDDPPPGPIFRKQTGWERFIRKFKEEPLVPLGIAATVAALLGATSALQKGNRTQFNKFLRYRVAAQGATVIAALGGSIYYANERQAARKAENALRAQSQDAAFELADPPAATPLPKPAATASAPDAADRKLV